MRILGLLKSVFKIIISFKGKKKRVSANGKESGISITQPNRRHLIDPYGTSVYEWDVENNV